MQRYLAPIKWLGGIALIGIVVAAIFPAIIPSLSEEAQNAVLVQSIPFFAAFVAVLLLFILLIALTAIRYNGQVPGRTYRAIEWTLIAGIVFGVISLFQPFSAVPYRYGFILLLGSTLSFILWSHVAPPAAARDARTPPLRVGNHVVGVIAGAAVMIALSGVLLSAGAPREPYGVRERLWNTYDDARKAEIAAESAQAFTVEIGYVILFSAFPAALVYFAAREVGAPKLRERATVQAVAVRG